MIQRTGFLGTGIFVAGIVAGPLFVTAFALAGLYRQLPAPIAIDDSTMAGYLMFTVIAITPGAIIALPLCGLCGMGMRMGGDRAALLRNPVAWVLTGGLAGGVITWLFRSDMVPEVAFALIATSAVCAGLCRTWIGWEEE